VSCSVTVMLVAGYGVLCHADRAADGITTCEIHTPRTEASSSSPHARTYLWPVASAQCAATTSFKPLRGDAATRGRGSSFVPHTIYDRGDGGTDAWIGYVSRQDPLLQAPVHARTQTNAIKLRRRVGTGGELAKRAATEKRC
jgi:hypothetical protein